MKIVKAILVATVICAPLVGAAVFCAILVLINLFRETVFSQPLVYWSCIGVVFMAALIDVGSIALDLLRESDTNH